MKKYLFFAIAVLMMLSACSKDSLYYEYEEYYTVKVNIDWSKANIKPNGASVYVYNNDGTLYSHESPFSNPNTGTIQLPAGDYKMMIFSDTPEEYSEFFSFQGMDNWQTASVQAIIDEVRASRAREQAAKAAAARAAAGETTEETTEDTRASRGINVGAASLGEYVKAPDTLAVATVEAFHVGGNKVVDYKQIEPNGTNILNTNSDINEVKLTSIRVIKDFRFNVHVKGLKFAMGQTETDLVGVAKGYYLGKGSSMEEKATHTFILNNRKYDEGSVKDGTITGSQLSFGLLPDTTSSYYLVIHFVLVDGTEYPITVDITDMITQSDIININLELELPEAEDLTGSVNVHGWSDEKVDFSL